MIDTVPVNVVQVIFPKPQTTIVLHLHAQILGLRFLPEIQASGDLGVRHERRVVRVVRMNVVIEIRESEGRTPFVGVEQLQGRRHAVGTLVLTGGVQTSEIVKYLKVRACLRTERKQA